MDGLDGIALVLKEGGRRGGCSDGGVAFPPRRFDVNRSGTLEKFGHGGGVEVCVCVQERRRERVREAAAGRR